MSFEVDSKFGWFFSAVATWRHSELLCSHSNCGWSCYNYIQNVTDCSFYIFIYLYLAHPLLALRLGEYWFCISLYVYDCNRPLSPILRQRCMMFIDLHRWWWFLYNGIEILGIQCRIRIEYFLVNNEQWTKESDENNGRTNCIKVEQW